MKALAITEAGKTSYIDIPRPNLSSGDVLLRLKRVGFCGTDLNTFRGLNPLVTYPRIPGHEIAAVIEALTPGVPEHFTVGMDTAVVPYTTCGRCSSCRAGRVNACRHNQTLGVQRDGAFTELIAVPWRTLIRSDKLTPAEHALIEPLSVGFHAVERGQVAVTDTVLVIGCGMIGLGAISGAAFGRGARVIAVDVDAAKLALATKAGAAETINSRSEDLHERVQALTGGDGPDVVIEAVGLPSTFRAAVDEVCFSGRVVYIGYAKEPVAYETKYFILKELDIRGSRNATAKNFADVIQVLESGRYPVDETITFAVPFSEAGAALAAWAADPSRVTRIHVDLWTPRPSVLRREPTVDLSRRRVAGAAWAKIAACPPHRLGNRAAPMARSPGYRGPWNRRTSTGVGMTANNCGLGCRDGPRRGWPRLRNIACVSLVRAPTCSREPSRCFRRWFPVPTTRHV